MEVHRPRAAHSIGEFLIEIGTIICGILIALGLEQVVAQIEWQHRIHAADEAMRRELLWDDGPQIYQRVAMHSCLTERLDAIRHAIDRSAPRAEVVRLIEGYRVEFLSYDTLARDDASHSGVTDHMSQAALDVWNNAYGQMPYMERTNAEEAAEIGHLRALRGVGGPLSDAEEAHVLDAVESLRMQELRMYGAAGFMLPEIRKLGPLDAGRVALFLDSARKWYAAACVKDLPSSWKLATDYNH